LEGSQGKWALDAWINIGMAETRTLLVSQTWTNFGDKSLQSLEQSGFNGPDTVGFVIKLFQIAAEDTSIWSVKPECCVNPRLTALQN